MVVRFTDSKNPGPSDRVSRQGESRDERLAPVTYLPGAKPNPAATAALASVEQAREAARSQADEAADGGASGRAGVSGGARKRAGALASNVSLHQLARRGMSRWELQQVLARRDVDERTAEAELDRLERVGLLDDAALAVTLVYTQHTRKGLGRTAIAHELRRRHIDPETIEDALAEIEDDDERQRALELAHKRAGQLRGVDDETARRRLSGFLARKGYSNEIVRAAVDSALASQGSGVRFQ